MRQRISGMSSVLVLSGLVLSCRLLTNRMAPLDAQLTRNIAIDPQRLPTYGDLKKAFNANRASFQTGDAQQMTSQTLAAGRW
jgi:hypothetical protein